MINPNEFYAARQVALSNDIQILTRKARWVGTFRLVCFLAIPVLLYVFTLSQIGIILAILSFAAFLFLVKRHVDMQKKIRHHQLLLAFFTQELESLETWNFTHFEGGEEYQVSGHAFAKDLGIFGKHSLFQMVSRAHPHLGQGWLAHEMQHFFTTQKEIKNQQQGVQELAALPAFREKYFVYAHEESITGAQFKGISAWFDNTYGPTQHQRLKVFGIVQSIVFLVVFLLALVGRIPWSLLILPLASMGVFLGPYLKTLNRLMAQSDGIAAVLKQVMLLLQLIERTPFTAPLLVQQQGKLTQGHVASQEIHRLFKAFKRLEYRQNLIVGFLLNVTCLWDAWSLLRIEQLKGRFQNNFQVWLDVVRFFDAMNSKALFAFNHPHAHFPTVENEGGIHFDAQDMPHPLIPPRKAVANSFTLENNGAIKLITGANMAGKSTFLRALGVTHVMASIGLPVFCVSLSFKPMHLFTSMLTVDDLSEEKSYFLAEVERLAGMVNYLDQHPDTLLIMDEILKGTNSHDKEEGSRRFIRKLIALGATGIIATHDLNLTHMENEYPATIQNLSFEVNQVGERMEFDYKLRNGATQTMNAMRLLQSKGLID